MADLETWGSGLTFGLVAAAFVYVPGWLLARTLWLRRPVAGETHARHPDPRADPIQDSTPWRWVLGLCAAAALLTLTRDTSRHAAARVEYCSALRDWPGVLEAARSLETWSASSRLHVLRALAHTERLPEDLFAFPLRRGDEVLPSYSAGLEMARALGQTLFELGQVNLAEHMAHEALELEGPRPDTLRLLADVNFVKNRPDAARVFLNRLRLIPFHRAAAERELRAAANDPGRADRADLNIVRTRLVRTDEPDPWLPPEILLRQLLESNRTNRMALDYLLAHRLVREELPALVDDLTHRNVLRGPDLPRPCEEALLALRESNPAAAEALRVVPFRPATAERYRQFREVAARFPGPSNSARAALAGGFGDTFWFYTLFGETAPVRTSRPFPGKP
jgi:hypothetical protein